MSLGLALLEIVGTITGPIATAVLGAEAFEQTKAFRSGVIDRLKSRGGRPGNHDIERAIRVAELQALQVILDAYRKRVEDLAATPDPIDSKHNPQEFIRAIRSYLQNSFVQRISLEIDAPFIAAVFDQVGDDIRAGAVLDSADGAADETAIVAIVEKELREAWSHSQLPPEFVHTLRHGRDDIQPFMPTYRAFLCEQLKTNERFRSILSFVMLQEIRERCGERGGDFTEAKLQESITFEVGQLQSDLGDIGKALGAIGAKITQMSGSLSAWEARFGSIEQFLGDFVAQGGITAIKDHVQEVLDGAYKTIGETAFAASCDRLVELQDQPVFGRDDTFKMLDKFLDENDRGTILMTGDAGIGKSRLLALWSDVMAGPETVLLRHFISARHPNSIEAASLCESLVRQTTESLGSGALGQGAGSIAPVSWSLRFLLTPVAADSFSRAAAARPLKPSAIYSSKRARSADGNGAGIRHPPGYPESRQQQFGNPKRFKIHAGRFRAPPPLPHLQQLGWWCVQHETRIGAERAWQK